MYITKKITFVRRYIYGTSSNSGLGFFISSFTLGIMIINAIRSIMEEIIDIIRYNFNFLKSA